jgi:hypothetical protein
VTFSCGGGIPRHSSGVLGGQILSDLKIAITGHKCGYVDQGDRISINYNSFIAGGTTRQEEIKMNSHEEQTRLATRAVRSVQPSR